MTKKAALLIDWENVKEGLKTENRWQARLESEGLLVKRLRQEADDFAQQQGHDLTARYVFAPTAIIRERAGTGFTDNLFTPVNSATSKNSADMHMIIKALDHFHNQGYTLFILVTGDADFIPLCEYLEAEGAETWVWHAQETQISDAMKAWKERAWFPGMNKGMADFLPPIKESDSDPAADDLFVLACHRHIDEGQPLSENRAIETVVKKWRLMSEDEFVDAFGRAVMKSRITSHQAGPKTIKIINYGQEEQFLAACDAVLSRLARGTSTWGELLGVASEETRDDASAESAIKALARAGYLARADDRYGPADRKYRFGIVHSLIRVGWTVFSIPISRKWENPGLVAESFIKELWRRSYMIGGKLSETQIRESDAECEWMIRRARQVSLIYGQGRRWKVDAFHPLAQRQRAEGRLVLEAVQAVLPGGSSTTKRETAQQALTTKGWSNSKANAWLDLLAATQQIAILEKGTILRMQESGKRMLSRLIEGDS
jgi:hypothetical protein